MPGALPDTPRRPERSFMPVALLSDLRNRLLSSADFREWAQKIPVFQWFARSEANDLFALCGGFIHSQVLLACVRLDLFERLRAGPKPLANLYAECGLPATRGRHLVEAAAALELLELRSRDRVALGKQGATLVDNPGVTSMVLHHALLYADLDDPLALFRGDVAVTRMSSLWAYAESEAPAGLDEGAVADYSELMAVSQAMVAEQVLAAVSLHGQRTLLDIGGGAGAFAMAAARRWPDLDVTVADLPPVAAIAREKIADAGLSERIRVVGADATNGELPAGLDVVSLVRILHDHDEDRALALARAAHAAVKPGGMLIVAEPMAGDDRAGRLVSAYFNVYLLAMGSGRPRTPKVLSALLREAGFSRVKRLSTGIPMITSVLVAER